MLRATHIYLPLWPTAQPTASSRSSDKSKHICLPGPCRLEGRGHRGAGLSETLPDIHGLAKLQAGGGAHVLRVPGNGRRAPKAPNQPEQTWTLGPDDRKVMIHRPRGRMAMSLLMDTGTTTAPGQQSLLPTESPGTGLTGASGHRMGREWTRHPSLALAIFLLSLHG